MHIGVRRLGRDSNQPRPSTLSFLFVGITNNQHDSDTDASRSLSRCDRTLSLFWVRKWLPSTQLVHYVSSARRSPVKISQRPGDWTGDEAASGHRIRMSFALVGRLDFRQRSMAMQVRYGENHHSYDAHQQKWLHKSAHHSKWQGGIINPRAEDADDP